MRAIDLFAGPGGWDEGIAGLDIRPLGIEWDDAACETRKAAGHWTLQADIAELDPRRVLADAGFDALDLLIASPPCQAFSAAGKGGGHKDAPLIYECADELVNGIDDRENTRYHLTDARSLLVIEPLRWALELRPTIIACEQVPPVLPLWQHFAGALRGVGYTTWTGILSAEQYGVPQTRKRAILLASLAGPVAPPAPTHQRYIAPRKEREEPSLFDAGERKRIVAPSEDHLLPWVSMAEALGWGMTQRPTTTITAGEGRQGGHDPLDGGSGSRAAVEREREREERGFRLHRGRGMNERHGERPDTPETEPAPTITSKARTARWILRTGKNTMSRSRNPQDMEPYERDVDAPAPTLTSQTEAWKVGPEGSHVDPPHRWKKAYDVRCNGSVPRPEDEPAPTITATGLSKACDNWVEERPATTITGDPRLGSPGHRDREGGERQYANAVRVTLEEAAILQGFRPDYPWQGSRSKKFEQVGNSVPPPLARAVISALLATAALKEAA